MNQASTLRRFHAFLEQFTFTLQALGKRQGESCFYGVDTLERREQATGFFGQTSTELVKDIAALVSFNLVGNITHPAHRSTFSCQFPRIGQPNLANIVTAFNSINNAQSQRVSGAYEVARRNHFQCLLGTHKARQALGTASTGQQTKLYFRQTHLGRRQGNPVMTTQGRFQATAQCGAMNSGNNGLVA